MSNKTFRDLIIPIDKIYVLDFPLIRKQIQYRNEAIGAALKYNAVALAISPSKYKYSFELEIADLKKEIKKLYTMLNPAG